jgi:HAD superfamily hydrolase (TIGR01509 family)
MSADPQPSSPGCGRCLHPALTEGVRALVLDFDGTLADTTHSHEAALHAALASYGVDLDPDWYRQHVGLSITDLLAAHPAAERLPHEEVVHRSRARLLELISDITAIDCVLELLHTAHRAGLPCAVASGASRHLVGPGLTALGLDHMFAAVVTREDVTRGKPAPDLFTQAAIRLGIPPGRCLAVDDAPDGIAAARRAGMHVLTVTDRHLAHAPD